jgi:tRNA threonylcarbamoyladenosine modification (KEOPS) complex  Pcc1 subunit
VTAPTDWEATIDLRRESPEAAHRLARALAPESSREVPRAAARVERPEPTVVRLVVSARDTGALRAALNTYLGWMQLATATEHRVSGR